MSLDNEKYDKTDDDESSGGTSSGGKGGQAGEVQFKAFIALGDEKPPLKPDEVKQLLSTHKLKHEVSLEKLKDLMNQRKAVKEGKISLQNYREGLQQGMSSQYKTNPVLANKAQFSGIDRQVNALPNENVSNTNNEKREELTYQYQLRYQPENAPKFNPRPIQR